MKKAHEVKAERGRAQYKRNGGSKPSLIDTAEGPMTRREAADRAGVPLNTIIRRVYEGWPAKDMLLPRRTPRPKEYVTGWGKLTLPRIAKEIGMSATALNLRLYNGWSEDEAFNTKPHARRGSLPIMSWDVWHAGKRAAENEGSTIARDAAD